MDFRLFRLLALFEQASESRGLITSANRKIGRTGAGLLPMDHGFFDLSVFEGMVGYDNQSSPRCHQGRNFVEKGLQVVHFLVNGYSERLKGFGCGMSLPGLM